MWPPRSPLSRDRRLEQTQRPLAQVASAQAGGSEPLTQPNTTGAKGRLSRASAKKPEIRCTQGAFHW